MLEARYSSAGKPKKLFIRDREADYEVELTGVETAQSIVEWLEESGLEFDSPFSIEI